MSKEILFGEEAKKPLIAGINKVANSVKVTLGPSGKLVLLGGEGNTKLTKDGVSVARFISLPDRKEQEGAKLLIEVSAKSNTLVGDGTSTSSVLAQAMVNTGFDLISKGSNWNNIKLGMDIAVQEVKDYLGKIRVKTKTKSQLKNVATISGNSAEVGNLVSEAFEAAGRKGVVTYEPTRSTATATLENVKGVKFERGYISPVFVNNFAKQTAEYQNSEAGVNLLMTSARLDNVQELADFLQKYTKQFGKAPLVIIAEEFAADVAELLAYNHYVKQAITVLPIRTPLYGDIRNDLMEDLAVITGGTFITPDKGVSLKSFNLDQLGRVKKIIATNDSTTFVEGFGTKEQVDLHVRGLNALMEDATTPSDKKSFKERIGKIVGGISVIRVGGQTDSEIKERLDRFEDAVNATSVAIDAGVLPGGGVALLGASFNLKHEASNPEIQLGYKIIKDSITEPFKTILGNAGIAYSEEVESLMAEGLTTNPNYGMDLRGKVYGDMMKMGVIDPYLVTISALDAALSITSLVLNTETLIVDHQEKQGA